MPRNGGNLKMQMHKAIDNKLKIGVSKVESRKEYRERCESEGKSWNPSKSDYIHSIKTAESYRQTINEFSKWIKENHSEVRKMEQVTKDIQAEYLKQRQDAGCSAWTTSKDMAALNKIFGCDLTKREIGLESRHLEDITRSREQAKMDSEYNADKYYKQMLMTESFGCRRESIYGGSYQLKENVSLYQTSSGDLYCRMIEKGGRYREAPCLEANKELILANFTVVISEPMTKAEFEQAYKQEHQYMFNEYTKHIDNHALRAEYAQNLYEQYKDNATSDEEWQGYNKQAVEQVSQALGHNRLDVIKHYVRLK